MKIFWGGLKPPIAKAPVKIIAAVNWQQHPQCTLERCWIFCFNIWPYLDFWAESESGGQCWLGTQRMDFYLFRFWGKGCAKGKVKVL